MIPGLLLSAFTEGYSRDLILVVKGGPNLTYSYLCVVAVLSKNRKSFCQWGKFTILAAEYFASASCACAIDTVPGRLQSRFFFFFFLS